MGPERSTKADDPKAHHYIPCVHLKNFVGSDEHVWTYYRSLKEPTHATPDETANQTHYYAFTNEQGERDVTLEHLLGKIESRAAPIYSELIQGLIPIGADRADFARFLAIMKCRTPKARAFVAEIIAKRQQIAAHAHAMNDEAFADGVERFQKATGKVMSEGEREDLRRVLIDPSSMKMSVHQDLTLMALKPSDHFASIFYEMNWSLIEPEQEYFITCDDPVAQEADPATYRPGFGAGGLENETTRISFPLSPKLMLLLSWEMQEGARYQGSRTLVEAQHAAFTANAYRNAYAHIRDERIARLLTGSKPHDEQVAVSGGPQRYAFTTIRRK